ncbi:MAG: class I SAM-dependent methyltransferase [Sedimenticolaceae bacterium]
MAMMPSVERFTCRVCSTSSDCEVVSLQEMMYGSRETFAYVLCSHCGSLQIRDIPSDLGRYYRSDYYSQLPRTEPPALVGLKRVLMRWYCRSAAVQPHAKCASMIRHLLPVPGDFLMVGSYLREAQLRSVDERILDVGCGASPHRLAAMRRCGFAAVEGVDPFVEEDTVYEGVPVHRNSIKEVNGVFGLVMFHHSLEHVPDPVATLKEAARLLRPGGTCLVRMPLMGTYCWRRFGVNWVELDAPRHLHLMTRQAMDILARRAGFRVRNTSYDSQPWEIASSILYQRGIPLRSSGNSGSLKPESPFSQDEKDAFAKLVSELNQQGDAGRGCFNLERC